jgi:hypothetical protein
MVQTVDNTIRGHRESGRGGTETADEVVEPAVLEQTVVRSVVREYEQRVLLSRDDKDGSERHRPRPEGERDTERDADDQPRVNNCRSRTPPHDAREWRQVVARQPAPWRVALYLTSWTRWPQVIATLFAQPIRNRPDQL